MSDKWDEYSRVFDSFYDALRQGQEHKFIPLLPSIKKGYRWLQKGADDPDVLQVFATPMGARVLALIRDWSEIYTELKQSIPELRYLHGKEEVEYLRTYSETLYLFIQEYIIA
jgi:hypothetical protein